MGKKGGGRAGSSSSQSGGGDAILELDPADIRFAHSKICPNFSGCGRSVLHTLEEIKSGSLRVEDLPMITVVRTSDADEFVSLNNRRLYVMKEARKLGLCNVVACRMRAVVDSRRERNRYTTGDCSLSAKLDVRASRHFQSRQALGKDATTSLAEDGVGSHGITGLTNSQAMEPTDSPEQRVTVAVQSSGEDHAGPAVR